MKPKNTGKADENATISGPGGTKNTQNAGILEKTRTSTERRKCASHSRFKACLANTCKTRAGSEKSEAFRCFKTRAGDVFFAKSIQNSTAVAIFLPRAKIATKTDWFDHFRIIIYNTRLKRTIPKNAAKPEREERKSTKTWKYGLFLEKTTIHLQKKFGFPFGF